ncbi:MAG: class I SAM-dependent methyltransferase [Citrobacter freundii]|nr:MAG: class I SAM-dependent methyltransferase [Citrobacter freundii]
MENNPNVLQVYDSIGDWFSQNRSRSLMEKPYLDQLIQLAGKGSTVLDIGCGTGVPIMHYLVEQGMNTLGVDGSARMLEIAQQNLPSAKFIRADMRELDLDQTFDAIIAWHSLFHLTYEEQIAMFGIFKKHLNNHGILMFTSGNEHKESWSINGGENLYHASLDTDHYRKLLEAQGFVIISYTKDDPDCGGATVWIAQLLK